MQPLAVSAFEQHNCQAENGRKIFSGGIPPSNLHVAARLGDQNHLNLLCGERKLVSLADPMAPFKAGADVDLKLKNPLFFDVAGERVLADA